MRSENKNLFLQTTNVVAVIITITVNALANILPLNGKYTGQISDSYPNLFAPAGYVFSIWGLIYTLLLLFAAHQALPRQRESPFLQRIGYLFILSSLANITWLFLWHYEQIVLSTIPMFILLATLVSAYLRLGIGRSDVSLREKILVHLPFSVYLGWITVASIGNVAAALTAISWSGWGIGDVAWTLLVIIVAAIITMAVTATRRDIAFSMVIIWALIGIIVKQTDKQILVLTAGTAITAIIAFLAFIKTKKTVQQRPSSDNGLEALRSREATC